MKKLFIVALAAIGMAACTQEELVEIKGGDAIVFDDAFLDNATRAAVDPSITTNTIDGFNVWAFMDEVNGTVFENEEVTKSGDAWTYANTQYWTPNHTYYFAALAPVGGSWTLNTDNANKLGAGIVNFINNDGGEDLLYAKQIVSTPADINAQPAAVKLEFEHLLSKVKFTFENGFTNDNAKLVVKNIEMTAPQGGSIDLAVADYAEGWVLNGTDATFAYGDLEAEIGMGKKAESANERLTVPASADYKYTITFTVELYMGDQLAQTFNETTELTGIALEMGKAYNFTANLTAANLGLYPITFDVVVDEWVEDGNVDLNVNTVNVKATNAAELAAALTSADAEYINVTLMNDIDLPINTLGQQTGGSGEYKLGGHSTQEINIDLGGNKLNITTGYWSALGCKNNDAVITIKNGEMTSTGNSAGTWNAWDLRFENCNYVFEGVNFLKAVALANVGKTTTMKDVTITDTHNTDTYGLWITAEGQTVNLENCTIDMLPASDGRGIKIDEQYVGDDTKAKVTLNVTNVTVKSEEKAAILVKSAKGAEINVNGINISEVAADTVNAVWVDSDAAQYARLVVVNGATFIVEDAIAVTDAASLAAALAVDGEKTIVLLADKFDGTYKMTNKTTILGNGAEVGAIDLNGADNVTLSNIKFDAANAVVGVDGKGAAKQPASICSATSNVGKGSNNVVIDGCTFSGTLANGGGAIAFTDQGRGTGQSGNITIKNCVFEVEGGYFFIYTYYSGKGYMNIENNTFKTSALNPIYLGRYQSSTPVVVKGNAFEKCNTFAEAAFIQAHSSAYTVSFNESNNTFAE